MILYQQQHGQGVNMASLKNQSITTSYQTLTYRTTAVPGASTYARLCMMDDSINEVETALHIGTTKLGVGVAPANATLQVAGDVRASGTINQVPINFGQIAWGWSTDAEIATGVANQFYIVPLFGKDNGDLNTLGGDLSGNNTGTPTTSKTFTSHGNGINAGLYYVPYNLEVLGGRVFLTSDSALTGNIVSRLYIMKYDITLDNGSGSGDLSNGVIMAQSSGLDCDSWGQINSVALTVNGSGANFATAGQAIFAAFVMASGYDPSVNVQLNVKYGSY